MKKCQRCSQEWPESHYYLRKDTGNRENTCKKCRIGIKKAWYAENADKQREQQYIRQYGITIEDYDRIFEAQEGRCAICRHLPRKKRFAVDHNHKTGEVRGILCDWCNRRLLGGCHEKIEMLEQAIQYLREPPARKVLDKDAPSD